jgi:hypothetical protein
MKQTGYVLLIVGLILTVVTTFTYFTKENVVDIGEIKITKDEPHSLNWSPFAGIAVMGIGAVLVWQSGKSKSV